MSLPDSLKELVDHQVNVLGIGCSSEYVRGLIQGRRRVSGPAATLLQVIAKEPAAVKRALQPLLE